MTKNKPCLSVKEVLYYKDRALESLFEDKLKELAKSKLK